MPYLTQELLKNCTSLIKLNNYDDLCSELCGYKSEVYGLRAEFGYPEHLITKNNRKYIAYFGIHKKKVKTSYGEAHFITFFHQPKNYSLEREFDILSYMYNIYMDEKSDELSENVESNVELFPYKITKDKLFYWKWIFENDWGVSDKIDLDNIIDDYEIQGYVKWDELYDILPENIDDEILQEIHSDEEELDSDEEETDDEIEEGEILSEYEA
tara:strand:+ start:1724 stop:2362 length:639 start_codon:yes stop_codon:yes gene_type:complete